MGSKSLSSARVLVVHGGGHIELAIARSLGRAGAGITVGSPGGGGLARFSRYAGDVLELPATGPQAMAEKILDALSSRRFTHVITAEESLIVRLNEHRAFLESVCDPLFPPQDPFAECLYKERTLERARRLGVPAPRTLTPSSLADVAACEDWRYPVVFKPAHRDPRQRPGGARDYIAQFAGNFSELRRALETLGPNAHPPMIQEAIPGQGVGIEALMRAGEPLALFQHRRVREKPASGGIGVLCESMPLDPRLADWATRLLSDLRWDGVAMVEFRVDPHTGAAGLIEINGRFWGSLPLALAAGLDFPAEFLRSRLDPHYRPCPAYRIGVRCRSLAHDTAALWQLVREPGPFPTRRFCGYLASFSPFVGGYVWAIDDPLPALCSPLSRLWSRTGSPVKRLAKSV